MYYHQFSVNKYLKAAEKSYYSGGPITYFDKPFPWTVVSIYVGVMCAGFIASNFFKNLSDYLFLIGVIFILHIGKEIWDYRKSRKRFKAYEKSFLKFEKTLSPYDKVSIQINELDVFVQLEDIQKKSLQLAFVFSDGVSIDIGMGKYLALTLNGKVWIIPRDIFKGKEYNDLSKPFADAFKSLGKKSTTP